MQRSTGLYVVVLVLAAACSSTADTPDATTTTSFPPTTSTTPAPTTSTTLLETTQVIGRLSRLDPGQPGIYEAGTFPPFEVEFELAGWKVDEIGPKWIQFSNNSPDAGPGVWGAVVAFRAEDSLDQLVEYFLLPEHQLDSVDHGELVINGHTARQIDVQVPPRNPPGQPDVGPSNYTPGDLRCSEGVVFYADNVQSQAPPWAQGLVGCAWNRVVIVDVDGTSMLLTISPDERTFDSINQLEDLGPYVDDFISAITFCTEATPCDG